MPTFQSIGINPELRSRFVTESTAHRQKGRQDAGSSSSNPHHLVQTPQALLSRNPASLRLLDRQTGDSKALSLPQINKLREEVAHALISQSRNGKRVTRLLDLLERNYIQHNDDESNLDENNPDDTSEAEEEAINEPFLTIEGTVSALDLLRYDSLKHHHQRVQSHGHRLSTGCPSLDELLALPQEYAAISTRMDMNIDRSSSLSSGIPFGYVTQFSGPPASGKTQLSLQIAASLSSSDMAHIWYLCSNASLRCYSQRLAQLTTRSHPPNRATTSSILEQTKFVAVTDEFQVLTALAEVESSLEDLMMERSTAVEEADNNDDNNKDEQSSVWCCCCSPCLLILDSASGCLSSSPETEEMLQRVASTLKRLARQYSLAVIVTNGSVLLSSSSSSSNPYHTSSDGNNQNTSSLSTKISTTTRAAKPALGRAWQKAADIQVWIEAVEDTVGGVSGATSAGGGAVDVVVRQATLERHPTKQCSENNSNSKDRRPPQSCKFRITSKGIEAVVL